MNGKRWLLALVLGVGMLGHSWGQVERIDSLEVEDLRVPSSGELTVASGAIARTGTLHTVDTEGDAASDDLATISGGTVGDVLILYPASDARTVVLDDAAGNILCAGSADITLDQADDWALLVYDGSNWLATGFTGGAAGSGATAFTGLSDVPSSYSGEGGKLVAVNSGATGLEFVSGSGLYLSRTIGDYTVDAAPDGAGDYVLFYDSSASTWDRVLIDDLGTGGGGGDTLPVVDTTGIAKGSVDATKVVRLEVDGLTTGTTRVITVPDANVDLTPTTGSFQGSDATLTALAGVSATANQLPYFDGSDTATVTPFTLAGRNLLDDADAAAQRATLGLVIGTDVQAQDAELAAIAGLTSLADRVPYYTGTGTAALATFTSAGRALVDDASAADQRTTLGLGTLATQASSSVSISGGTITGITDIAIADGGTGASTAAGARVALGLDIGVNVQAYDAELAALAGVASAADTLPYFTGSGTASGTTLTLAGRNFLDDADVTEQRSTLGLGTMATQAASGVTISGGTITGITDLAIADGGTGASTAANARTNLGLVIGTDVQAYDADLTDLADGTLSGSKVEDVFLRNDGDAGTGVYDFGGATSFELPSGAAPTVDAIGEIALDTTWEDVNDGLFRYYDGKEMGVIAVPTAELDSLADGQVLTYNGSVKQFQFVAGGAGSGAPFTVSSGTAFLQDNTDSTKQVAFDVSAITTSTVRDIVVPDQNVDLTPDTGTFAGATAALTALGALTPSADQVPYFTGATTASLFEVSSTARSLLNDADTATMRTTLGLAIGTNVQAYDGDLGTIAALSPTKGNVIVGNGSAWVSVGVGTNDQVLTADSAQSAGVKWATPAGGGGTTVTRKVKATDESNSTETLDDVDDLGFSVAANTDYHIVWQGTWTATGTGNGMELSLNGPSGATLVQASIEINASATAQTLEPIAAYETVVTNGTAPGGSERHWRIEALIRNGSTSGTVVPRFASELAAGATAQIEAGSWGVCTVVVAP